MGLQLFYSSCTSHWLHRFRHRPDTLFSASESKLNCQTVPVPQIILVRTSNPEPLLSIPVVTDPPSLITITRHGQTAQANSTTPATPEWGVAVGAGGCRDRHTLHGLVVVPIWREGKKKTCQPRDCRAATLGRRTDRLRAIRRLGELPGLS